MDNIYLALQILEIEPGASFKDAKKAYRRLSKKWHPDRYRKHPEIYQEANNRLKKIIEAYETIKNYDTEYGLENIKANNIEIIDNYISNNYDYHHKNYSKMDSSYNKDMYIVGIIGIVIVAILSISIITTITGLLINHNKPIEFIKLGDSSQKVLSIAGNPRGRCKNSWFYKDYTLFFDNNILTAYEAKKDQGKLLPIKDYTPIKGIEQFTIGSSKNEVYSAMGHPDKASDTLWVYSGASINFKDNKVKGYRNNNNFLKCTPMVMNNNILSNTNRTYISKGSSKEEVLSVIGMPTGVQENRWYYGPSQIFFKNNKIEKVIKLSSDLKYR